MSENEKALCECKAKSAEIACFETKDGFRVEGKGKGAKKMLSCFKDCGC